MITTLALSREVENFVELSRNQALRLPACLANINVIWEAIEDDSYDIVPVEI